MIIDAHCHAWEHWPYQPPVPDPESRGRIEQLAFEMAQNGIDRAVVICARIDHNPGNNDYVAQQARLAPERFVQFADVDCRWWSTHHTPGAAERLAEAAQAFGLRGFTHYLDEEPTSDGRWLLSSDGAAFLQKAADLKLILSLACAPHHLPLIGEIARRWPELSVLCHHMARIRGTDRDSGIRLLLAVVDCPNVHVKISGFGYAAPDCQFPYDEIGWMPRMLAELLGPRRLLWGSDYPVVRRYMTYRQAIQVAKRHLSFLGEGERALVFGGNMARLLGQAAGEG